MLLLPVFWYFKLSVGSAQSAVLCAVFVAFFSFSIPLSLNYFFLFMKQKRSWTNFHSRCFWWQIACISLLLEYRVISRSLTPAPGR